MDYQSGGIMARVEPVENSVVECAADGFFPLASGIVVFERLSQSIRP